MNECFCDVHNNNNNNNNNDNNNNNNNNSGPLKVKILDTNIPEFLKTGLAKIRAHSTTWQLKAIKSVQRPIKMPISDAEQ